MAALSQLLKERKKQLRDLRTQIIRTEAGFNLVRREVDRLIVRKNAIPESTDLSRLVDMMVNADREFDRVTAVVRTMTSNWR